MGQISMATRDELVVALAGRYAASNRKERGRILDEFAAVSGLRRKLAMRLLHAGQLGRRSGLGTRPARRLYNDAVREAPIVTWEASGRVCGKRLRPLVPILVEAMERHGHLQLAPEVRAGLLAMSTVTIDRALRQNRILFASPSTIPAAQGAGGTQRNENKRGTPERYRWRRTRHKGMSRPGKPVRSRASLCRGAPLSRD